jgi:hypothetical protein
MFTALDAPPGALDPAEQAFVGAIREHGWFRTNVLAEDRNPGFSFSTGFWVSLQQPEILIFSTRSDIAHDVFWDLYRTVARGEALRVGSPTDQVFANLPACLFPVSKRHYAKLLGWSRWFYGGDEFPCLQIVWPDPAGLFPWQDGFDAALAGDQIDLSEAGWRSELRQ